LKKKSLSIFLSQVFWFQVIHLTDLTVTSLFLGHTCFFFISIFISKAFEHTFEHLARSAPAVILAVQNSSGLFPCHFSRTIPNSTETEGAAGSDCQPVQAPLQISVFSADRHLCLLKQLSDVNCCPSVETLANICVGNK